MPGNEPHPRRGRASAQTCSTVATLRRHPRPHHRPRRPSAPTTTVRFDRARPGRRDLHRPRRRHGRRRSRSTASTSTRPRTVRRRRDAACRRCRRERAAVVATGAVHRTPARACTASSTRSTTRSTSTRQFEVPDARRVFAVFEQPDLKATFAFTVTAPAALAVVSNAPTPEPTAGAADGERAHLGVPADRRGSRRYITALVAGPYHVVRDEVQCRRRHVPARRLLPPRR